MRLSRLRPSRLAAPTAVAALALTLAGCGSGGGEPVAEQAPSAVEAMQRVADNSRTVESASYTFDLSGTGGLAIGAKGSGAYQTEPVAMQMVFDELRVAGQAIPGGMEQRIVGDTMYLKTGFLGSLLGGKAGNGWMKVPRSSAGTANGLDSMLSQSSQVDPRGQLQLLLASENVRKVGEEKVDGVATTHYAAELGADEIAKESKLDEATRAQLQKAYSSAGVGKIGIDVWVDSEDRARRFVTTAPSIAGNLRMAIDFTDYGKTLDITAPEGAADFVLPGLLDSMTHGAEAPKAS